MTNEPATSPSRVAPVDDEQVTVAAAARQALERSGAGSGSPWSPRPPWRSSSPTASVG